MIYDDKHHRRSIRLKDYDYSGAGAYFVTICAWNRECLFGDIRDGEMGWNEYGRVVMNEWRATAVLRHDIQLDEYIVMPNHFHGVLAIIGRGTARRAPTIEQFAKPISGSFPTIIRSFKSAVTKSINTIRNTPGMPVWQRNYYEHVIRDDDDLNRIRQYIVDNRLKWGEDENNPANMKPKEKAVR